MIKDFVKKEQRLKKHFDLAEGDDSWGFENSPLNLRTKMPLWEKLLYTAILGYFVYYIIQALTVIF